MARFLHTNVENRSFWTQWREQHNDSLRSCEAICFCLAKNWFACDLPEEVEVEVRNLSPAVQQWLQDFNSSPLEGMFRPNKDGVWLHVSLLESSRDKWAVLGNALAPMHVPTAGAPGQDVTRQGQRKKFWPSQRHAKYLFYLTSKRRLSCKHSCADSLAWRTLVAGHEEAWQRILGFLRNVFFSRLRHVCIFFPFQLLSGGLWIYEQATGPGNPAPWHWAAWWAQFLPDYSLNRFGLRRTLFLCFAMLSSVTALRALVTTEPIQLGLSFLAGTALSIWAVSISPSLAQLTTEDNRPFGFSLVFSSGIGIAALGGLVGGGLPGWLSKTAISAANTHTNRVALLISCGIIALGMWPLSHLTFHSATPRRERGWVRNPFLFRFLPVIAIWSLVTNAFAPFFNVYFSQYIHLPIPKIGLVFAISQLSQVLAILFTPLIFRKFGLVTGIVYSRSPRPIALGALAGVRGTITAALAYVIYMAFQWMRAPACTRF